jgi:CRP/FNR family cyclic AMP-dependent transcriptional regulator
MPIWSPDNLAIQQVLSKLAILKNAVLGKSDSHSTKCSFLTDKYTSRRVVISPVDTGCFPVLSAKVCVVRPCCPLVERSTKTEATATEMKDIETQFDLAAFLTLAGVGREVVPLKKKETLFRSGDNADCVFYLQSGRAKLTILSKGGKEKTIALLEAGDFVGEESVVGKPGLRLMTARTMTPCTVTKIMRAEMIRVIHEEQVFRELFLTFVIERGLRAQADLIDQRFNSSEKRLARILLRMAEYGQPEEQWPTIIPKISQAMLAELVGTTRSRVSFFMNRFYKQQLIDYCGGIKVNKSLLNMLLHD